MIYLDENFPESQRLLLLKWRFNIRQIGYEVGSKGLQDDEIIPFLIKLSHPTFFTLDSDFFTNKLCHSKYCLVFLDVEQYEAATFIKRFLRLKEFNTRAKRMGTVSRVSQTGILVWRFKINELKKYSW